ncbi:MAG: pirin family protein [Lautropia sp.]
MKQILGVYSAPRPHWVGDGFPVRSMFGYDGLGRQLSPFLLLDHAAPTRFAPAARPRGVGRVRVIAGEFAGHRGPAQTFTPIDVRDVRIDQGGVGRFEAKDGHTLALVVLRGTVLVNGDTVAREGQLVHFDRAGSDVAIEANSDATLLWLSGEPIDEPVVGYGPFVMNSEAEIRAAIDDFNGGRFGRIPPATLAGAAGRATDITA